jgi:hypothetical protein
MPKALFNPFQYLLGARSLDCVARCIAVYASRGGVVVVVKTKTTLLECNTVAKMQDVGPLQGGVMVTIMAGRGSVWIIWLLQSGHVRNAEPVVVVVVVCCCSLHAKLPNRMPATTRGLMA